MCCDSGPGRLADRSGVRAGRRPIRIESMSRPRLVGLCAVREHRFAGQARAARLGRRGGILQISPGPGRRMPRFGTVSAWAGGLPKHRGIYHVLVFRVVKCRCTCRKINKDNPQTISMEQKSTHPTHCLAPVLVSIQWIMRPRMAMSPPRQHAAPL